MGIFDFLQKSNRAYADCRVGDSVLFGEYYFENEKDRKPVEWIVLDSNERELLLMSKYCLDTIKYCEPLAVIENLAMCIWENSYLRNWLNNVFYHQAFSEKEKKRIVETDIVTDRSLDAASHKNKVFLLSKQQILELMPNKEARIGSPTPYAVKKGANIGDGKGQITWWWTLPYIEEGLGRPPRRDYPSAVCQDGQINYHSRLVYNSNFTVRPAIKIKK